MDGCFTCPDCQIGFRVPLDSEGGLVGCTDCPWDGAITQVEPIQADLVLPLAA